ncbi:hypothetical protein [Sphingomonas qomolangmaensis]|uniref:Uncharacterized protein n=1 Tax=Sphingomonas qomolangmaensis TaxID=2918765 RepID=A0ABY5LDH8_9SPHN|nr:hypothetical protein [Sphingomonas qomolangmaensis]UUL83942.1 hypothetical protein NMP03_07050 [Sphingomonas qomolangmaensis]
MTPRWTAIGGASGLAIALAASWPMLGAIADLNEARAAQAALAAEIAAPPVPRMLADARLTPAPDAATASRRAALRLRRAATAGGVLVETLEVTDPAAPHVVRLTLSASGSEKAVLAFADGIERGDPVLRWRRWRLASVSGGAVRVEGEVLVPWR